MQRWEYLVIAGWVNATFGNWSDGLGRSGNLPDEASLAELMNGLGEQSWELTGVAFSTNPREFRLFLKRPRP